MKRIIKIIGIAFMIGLLVMLIWLFKPVPIVSEEQSLLIHGKLDYVFDGGEFDIVIKLMDMDTLFYINRGQEKGIDLVDINHKYKGRMVTIHYPKYWTPLDPKSKVRHASKWSVQDTVLFNELSNR